MNLEATFGTDSPIIGMVHLAPLPGAPGDPPDIEAVIERAVTDAAALERGGVDAVMVENLGDAPFYPDSVPTHVVAAMTRVTDAVIRSTDLPTGVNVLRNDPDAALAIASATGCAFIRVNVHTGARVTDQGVIQGRAHETVRKRDRIAPHVAIMADLAVKHSTSLTGERPTAGDLDELVARGKADAVILSGTGTGEPTDEDWVRTVIEWRSELGLAAPIIIGSGVDHRSVSSLLDVADGAIVGTALKEDGAVTAPVDEDRVERLVDATNER